MESRSGSKRRYDEVEPRVQRRIVAEYRQGVRGYGYIATAKRLQLPVSTAKGAGCSDYLARADPPFTTKVIQDQEPEELSEEWRAGARRWLEGVKKIRLD